jgi:predicted phage terminase large subunit-like protein
MAANNVIGLEPTDRRILEDDWRFNLAAYAKHVSGDKWIEYEWQTFLADKLTDAALAGGARIIITAPPRHGKSEITSRWLPMWYLDLFPEKRVILTSYSIDLVRNHSEFVRNHFDGSNPEVMACVDPNHAQATDWRTTEGGGMRGAGVGGGITGFGADCVARGTMVETERGPIAIERLILLEDMPKVLSWDHKKNRACYRRILASRKINGRKTVEITTESGRKLRCTPDHKIFISGRGYVEAQNLRRGDSLKTKSLCDMRGENVEEFDDMHELLPREARRENCGKLRSLQEDIRTTALRDKESKKAGEKESVLFPRMCGKALFENQATQMRTMQWRGSEENTTVLRSMQKGQKHGQDGITTGPVFGVQDTYSKQEVLFDGMLKLKPLEQHGREREFKLQERNVLCKSIQVDAPIDFRARHEMRDMWGQSSDPIHADGRAMHAFGCDNPPHQRKQKRQQARKPSGAVSAMPHEATQITRDTVSVVRELRGKCIDIYDIQVEGTHNFFAGEILSHNCVIIDDPHKDWASVQSPTQRQHVIDWLNGTVYHRLEPNGSIILIQTRWNQGDLAGYLLTEHPDDWVEIRLPAIAEEDDMLGREPGEPLCEERYDTEALNKIRRAVGSQVFAGLFQQRPAPSDGNIIKREWIQYYGGPTGIELHPKLGKKFMSWDLNFGSETKTGSYAVGQVWAENKANMYLLDQVRGRWEYTKIKKKFRDMVTRWPDIQAKYIEKAAAGAPLISDLKNDIKGILPVKPVGSKSARLEAIAPLFEAGNVWLPHPTIAPWVPDLVEELVTFPNAMADDQVDTLSQALNQCKSSRGGPMKLDLSVGLGSSIRRL